MARSIEETRKAKREQMALARARDPELARQKLKTYRENNKEKEAARMRNYTIRRFFWIRSVRLKSKDRASPAELSRLWKAQRGRCAMTGQRLDRTAELDHIVPKARGGGDDIGNLRWTTKIINRAKRDLTDEEFTALCSVFLMHTRQQTVSLQQHPA